MKNNHIENSIIELINSSLNTYLPKTCGYNNNLVKALDYSLNSGGKRIRPILLLAMNLACDGDINEALPFACAVEYIHTYSLIHDDLPCMDNDDYRRGKLTNHKVFGESMALLAGDELLTAANRIIAHEIEKDNAPNKIKAMSSIINNAENMIMGQVADISWQDSEDLKDLTFVHENKTMALMNGSIMAGAYLANASDNQLNKAQSFAENFGFAFQIADDICDKDNDQGPNYVKLVGLDQSLNVLNEKIQNARDAICSFQNKEILIGLCDKILDSVK